MAHIVHFKVQEEQGLPKENYTPPLSSNPDSGGKGKEVLGKHSKNMVNWLKTHFC